MLFLYYGIRMSEGQDYPIMIYRKRESLFQGSARGMSDFLIYVNNYSIVAIEREDAKPDHLNYQIPKF